MSKDDKPISDQLKQVVDELQLEERVKDLSAAAEQVVLRGLDATGTYFRDHRGEIEGFIDRAGAAIDRQTSGRFAEQVEQVRSQLSSGLASIADREWTRPGIGSEPGPEPLPGPADPDGWTASTDDV